MQTEQLYNNFVNEFCHQLYAIKNEYTDMVFLCIGTDRITGDSYGPLVGYQLINLFKEFGLCDTVSVVGTLESPVSYCNVEETVNRIYRMYTNPGIVAIDSAVSRAEDIGKIFVSKGGMCFGKGLNKKGILVGDISIKGVVAKNTCIPRNNLEYLQNTPLNIVMNLAEVTSRGIYETIKYI